LSVLTEIHNRGVKDILIACVDGLTGFPNAIETVFPKTHVQLCIVHMIRNSIACSAAYVTPVSSAVNMLVMEPGGYTFGSYVKVGLPLLLLTMLVTVGLVTLIYPL